MEEEKKEFEAQEELKEEEVIEETPSLEPKTTEEKKEDIDSLLPGPKPIEKIEDERPYEEIIESARLEFVKKYKKHQRLSYIMMAIVMVVAVASVVCITQTAMVFKIVGWSLIGSAIVGMLVFYIVTKNNIPYMTKDYIQLINNVFNAHNYLDTNTKDAATDDKEKLELAELIVDGLYKDLGNIASRNVIHAKYKEKSFVAADLGLYNNGQGRKRLSVFVGKYISMQNSLHFTDHYIVNIKAKENPVDLPSDIESMEVLLEEDNLIVFGPKGGDYKKALGTKLIPELKKVALDENLLNANFVFWAGHSTAYLSYTDDIMTLPFQTEFTGKANNKYREDLYAVLEAFASINK